MSLGFSAAIFTGGPRRLDITAKSIDSLNDQSYKNLQKILVNGGSPPHQTAELISKGVDLDGWTIIDFPIDTYVRTERFSLHRWPGQAALLAATNEFFFTMNDDDHLATDFFERMSVLFEKYPLAVTGMGLPVSYYHDTNTSEKTRAGFGNPIQGDKSHLSWRSRPECEPGIDLVRKIFCENLGVSYYTNPGFQLVCRTDLVREVSDTFFSVGGFPDNASPLQVAIRGDTVFDPEALMFWGRHSGQEHFDKDTDHYWLAIYKEMYGSFSKINSTIIKRFLPDNLNDIKKVKQYYRKALVGESLSALLDYFSVSRHKKSNNRSEMSLYKKRPIGARFPFFVHALIVLRNPFLFMICLKPHIKAFIKNIKR